MALDMNEVDKMDDDGGSESPSETKTTKEVTNWTV
jgi:hypothetical protein